MEEFSRIEKWESSMRFCSESISRSTHTKYIYVSVIIRIKYLKNSYLNNVSFYLTWTLYLNVGLFSLNYLLFSVLFPLNCLIISLSDTVIPHFTLHLFLQIIFQTVSNSVEIILTN